MPSLHTLLLASMATLTAAKVIDDTCTSYTELRTSGSTPYFTTIYYDPTNLEICTVLSCGGGRAAPRLDDPRCAFYTGTETQTTTNSDELREFLPTDPAAAAEPTEEVEPTGEETGVQSSSEIVTGSAPVSTTAGGEGSDDVTVSVATVTSTGDDGEVVTSVVSVSATAAGAEETGAGGDETPEGSEEGDDEGDENVDTAGSGRVVGSLMAAMGAVAAGMVMM